MNCKSPTCEAVPHATSEILGVSRAAYRSRLPSCLAAWLLAACTSSPVSPPPAEDRAASPTPAEDLGASYFADCAPADGGEVVAALDASTGSAPDESAADGGGGYADDAGAGAAADSTSSRDGGGGPNGRPLGVATCYDVANSDHPATLHLRQAIGRGDLAARDGVINELQAAAAANPEAEQFALQLALANLWRLAEPFGIELVNPLLLLDTLETARREFERAYALCPTDHRIPGWLGPLQVATGRILGDSALIDQGLAVLRIGMDHYPSFVAFSQLLVYADQPTSDPDFMKAVAAVRDLVHYCTGANVGPLRDPACMNGPGALRNIEGTAIYRGDLYAKLQDREAALTAYTRAKLAPDWESWSRRALLEERIGELDARIAAAASESTLDDLESAWQSSIQCSLCHQD